MQGDNLVKFGVLVILLALNLDSEVDLEVVLRRGCCSPLGGWRRESGVDYELALVSLREIIVDVLA